MPRMCISYYIYLPDANFSAFPLTKYLALQRHFHINLAGPLPSAPIRGLSWLGKAMEMEAEETKDGRKAMLRSKVLVVELPSRTLSVPEKGRPPHAVG
jgi:hypothetical protein